MENAEKIKKSIEEFVGYEEISEKVLSDAEKMMYFEARNVCSFVAKRNDDGTYYVEKNRYGQHDVNIYLEELDRYLSIATTSYIY